MTVTPKRITVPSSDIAFQTHVSQVERDVTDPRELETRLRRLFPRVVVRERALWGEAPAWYVYRDGGWRPSADGEWWEDASLPRVVVSPEGFLLEASATAAGILEIDPSTATEHHFTDFVVPGTLDDSLALFRVVGSGHDLTATVLLRPRSGAAVAVELHSTRVGSNIVGVFRLAGDLEPRQPDVIAPPPALRTVPATDVAFRSYVLRALRYMPEPTPEGLAIRIRRLYPHASTRVDGEMWVAQREPEASDRPVSPWWTDQQLPRVRYDAQALILEANRQAEEYLGRELVGHYWQEFVTPGSTEDVALMLEILAEVGAAESRFRMPRADGDFVEFESYTSVDGEEFVTVMRPAQAGLDTVDAATPQAATALATP